MQQNVQLVILKLIFVNGVSERGQVSFGSGSNLMTSSCEYGNQSSGSVSGEEFFDRLKGCYYEGLPPLHRVSIATSDETVICVTNNGSDCPGHFKRFFKYCAFISSVKRRDSLRHFIF